MEDNLNALEHWKMKVAAEKAEMDAQEPTWFSYQRPCSQGLMLIRTNLMYACISDDLSFEHCYLSEVTYSLDPIATSSLTSDQIRSKIITTAEKVEKRTNKDIYFVATFENPQNNTFNLYFYARDDKNPNLLDTLKECNEHYLYKTDQMDADWSLYIDGLCPDAVEIAEQECRNCFEQVHHNPTLNPHKRYVFQHTLAFIDEEEMKQFLERISLMGDGVFTTLQHSREPVILPEHLQKHQISPMAYIVLLDQESTINEEQAVYNAVNFCETTRMELGLLGGYLGWTLAPSEGQAPQPFMIHKNLLN